MPRNLQSSNAKAADSPGVRMATTMPQMRYCRNRSHDISPACSSIDRIERLAAAGSHARGDQTRWPARIAEQHDDGE